MTNTTFAFSSGGVFYVVNVAGLSVLGWAVNRVGDADTRVDLKASSVRESTRYTIQRKPFPDSKTRVLMGVLDTDEHDFLR